MPLIHTDQITPGTVLSPSESFQTYCGLDSMVTLEVLGALRGLRNQPPEIYSFTRALQGPYMEIMQRGFRVNESARRVAAAGLRERMTRVNIILNKLALAAWGKGLNPRSYLQLQQFFYGAMRLPEVWISQKGVRKLSTNREALEKLDEYMQARPFVSCILTIRDLAKQLEVFETEIDADGRYRTSYNIVGTESGRASSSSNAFGTGGNAQNIAGGLRYVFEADPGWKLCVIDLEQVEARDVGWFCGTLFDDWTYLDACESGDLHTTNATLIWPEMRWPIDPGACRRLAETQFYREYSFRDMSKRGGHLTNYVGQPWTMSRSLKIPIKLAEEFQSRYCTGPRAAFPAIPRWWQWTQTQLQTTHQFTNPFGRNRHFFGRPGDDSTLREAVANQPQSTTADRINLGLWRIWYHMREVQVLAQTHDSVTFQYREPPAGAGVEEENRIISRALELIRVPLHHGRRTYVVPGEAKIGWNWGNVSKDKITGAIINPEGLLKWSRGKPDTRVRRTGLQKLMIGK